MRLVEHGQIISSIVPINLDTGANAGDWISMKNYNHATIIFFAGTGTAASDPVIKFDQSKVVAGTDPKTLNIDEIYHKTGDTALDGVSEFTRVTQSAGDGYDSDPIAGGENENIIVIELDRDELDTDNNFDCFQVDVDQMGAAKFGCVLCILTEPRYTGAEAIAD